MYIKEIEDLVNEFLILNNEKKFQRKYICYFSNGVCANFWFKKYEEDILNSTDPRSEIIRKQYEEYKQIKKRQKTNNSIAFYMITFGDRTFLEEFNAIEDTSKFEPDCKIYLSNGVNAYQFFKKIIDKIMNNKDSLYLEAKTQLMEYKNKKYRVNYKKNLLLFYKKENKGKFDLDSNVILSNGLDAGLWFHEYKEHILSSKGPIESGIREQYELYLTHYDLAKEFLEEERLEKFDSDSNVRFISRALMNLWWEDNKEMIKYSDLNLDELITQQYKSYIKEKKF